MDFLWFFPHLPVRSDCFHRKCSIFIIIPVVFPSVPIVFPSFPIFVPFSHTFRCFPIFFPYVSHMFPICFPLRSGLFIDPGGSEEPWAAAFGANPEAAEVHLIVGDFASGMKEASGKCRGWVWCPYYWGFVSPEKRSGDEISPFFLLGDVNHWDTTRTI